MRIAQISKADAFGGGASRVAEELTGLLNRNGTFAEHWCSWSGNGYGNQKKPLYGRYQRPIRRAHTLLRKLGFPELIPFELAILLRKSRIWDYDLIHFHDLSSAISPQTLWYLSRYRPVLWTLHDCSAFTGGCLYPMDCTKFRRNCGRCPQIGEWPIDCWFDFTGLTHSLKRRLAKTGRVVTLTPSRWMSDTAFSSGIYQYKPLVVNNGIDTDIFRPRDRGEVRARLGLPPEAPMVLLSAGNFFDERKGTRFALEALRGVSDLGIHLLVVGNMDDRSREHLNGFAYHEAGYVGDPARLAEHYAAADAFVFCSLADNQPLVVLETMAAGTPLIGFATGGIPELVLQDQTGFLVPQRDIQALVAALRHAFTGDRLKRWGENARQRAVEKYSHARFLASHMALYEQVLRGEFDIWRRGGPGTRP